MSRGFSHVEAWVFDLDNTLYPASCRLFDQIDRRMGEFIVKLLQVEPAEAKRIQKNFFRAHGTTLRGLMDNHNIDPHGFLDFVHDIDHSDVPASPALVQALARLPGRRFVFTNGTTRHAQRVLERLGITKEIDEIVDIVHSGFVPKPERAPYLRFIQKTGIAPQRTAMFEDIARNLELPHELGMTTVLVQSADNADGNMINAGLGDPRDLPFVHHITQDLQAFLGDILEKLPR